MGQDYPLVFRDVALIQNSVIFSFSGATGLDLDSIHNVSFQYGTEMNEPNLPIPEPATWSLLGIGLVAVVARRRKLI